MAAQYTIKSTLIGSKRVHLACAACGESINFDLEDAGKTLPCPQCGQQMRVPGEPELDEERARVMRKQSEAEAAKAAARALKDKARVAKQLERLKATTQSGGGTSTSGVHSRFEVQSIDPKTGAESWTLVSAANADEARKRATDAGMIAGAVRLVAVEEPHVAPDALANQVQRAMHGSVGYQLLRGCLFGVLLIGLIVVGLLLLR